MKILLFGATGMLGRYVHKVLNTYYDVMPINRNQFDILHNNWDDLEKILKNCNCDAIVNCIGIIPQKYKNDNYREYIKINSLFPHKINDFSKKYNYKFIHISTDCVFDGRTGNYSETDTHAEKNIYGVSKSLGEPNDATIIRTSIIGEELYNKSGLLEWLITNKNGEIDGFTNHYWNGVTCLTLANIINETISKNLFWKGVRHIFSHENVSKYELCKFINEIYELNINIKPKEASYIDRTLKTNFEYNFEINSIYEQIEDQKKYSIKYGNSTI